MFVRLKKNSHGRISGIAFDFKASVVTMSMLMVIFSFFSAVKLNCNNGTAYARVKIIRPEAENTFVRMHRPFEDKLNNQCYDIKLTRMMVERLIPSNVKQECIQAMRDSTWRVQ